MVTWRTTPTTTAKATAEIVPIHTARACPGALRLTTASTIVTTSAASNPSRREISIASTIR